MRCRSARARSRGTRRTTCRCPPRTARRRPRGWRTGRGSGGARYSRRRCPIVLRTCSTPGSHRTPQSYSGISARDRSGVLAVPTGRAGTPGSGDCLVFTNHRSGGWEPSASMASGQPPHESYNHTCVGPPPFPCTRENRHARAAWHLGGAAPRRTAPTIPVSLAVSVSPPRVRGVTPTCRPRLLHHDERRAAHTRTEGSSAFESQRRPQLAG